MKKKTICILTATRAEYGLLYPIIVKLQEYAMIEVKIVVTGMHLSPEFGLTYQEIEQSGMTIDRKIEMLVSADTPSSISKSMGIALISFADYFAEIKPDMLVVLGDRYETLAVAIAAMNERIPIAHLYGGDISEGAVDDVVRHAITKLSYLHFTATKEHRKRVIQMGEEPKRVFCVGAMSVENARRQKKLTREELQREIGFYWEPVNEKLAIVTYHPVTLEDSTAEQQIDNLLDALDTIDSLKIIFTKANADAGGRIINQKIEEYVSNHPEKCAVYASLGQVRYLSAISMADVVIGNSSSGLSEVPSFHVPTVNIGDRQRGRMRGETVISCSTEKSAIGEAVKKALSPTFREEIADAKNPYEKEGTSENIVKTIVEYLNDYEIDLKKKFFDVIMEIR